MIIIAWLQLVVWPFFQVGSISAPTGIIRGFFLLCVFNFLTIIIENSGRGTTTYFILDIELIQLQFFAWTTLYLRSL